MIEDPSFGDFGSSARKYSFFPLKKLGMSTNQEEYLGDLIFQWNCSKLISRVLKKAIYLILLTLLVSWCFESYYPFFFLAAIFCWWGMSQGRISSELNSKIADSCQPYKKRLQIAGYDSCQLKTKKGLDQFGLRALHKTRKIDPYDD